MNKSSYDAAIDAVIREQFPKLSRSVDDLLCHPAEAEQFAYNVNSSLHASLPASKILGRLITLRKRGSDKGGLPRSA